MFFFSRCNALRTELSSQWWLLQTRNTNLHCGQYTHTRIRNQHGHHNLQLNKLVFCVLREKSKKFAEQAAAIVCLRMLGVPEGRIGEEDSGLVCKRKRERALDCSAVKEGSKKRIAADSQQREQRCCSTAANGDAQGRASTPPKEHLRN